MEQCYPFLDEFEICGVIDDKTEKEHLTLIHVPTQDKTSIDCFHTVIGQLGTTDATYESTEGAAIDTLDLESKKAGVFGAAQFFSENGINAFKIHHSIQENTHVQPYAQNFLPFVAKHNRDALKMHVEYAIDTCTFQGKPHKNCLIANLLPFKNILLNFVPMSQALAFPLELLSDRVRESLAMNHDAPTFPEYARFFSDQVDIIRKIAAENPNATTLPNYTLLFTDPNTTVRYYTAKNPNAPTFPEYSRLFTDPNKTVRMQAAENPNAPKSSAYIQLFTDQDPSIRKLVAENPNAPTFPEYTRLFTDRIETVRYYTAKNPNAPTFPEYARLFTDGCEQVREKACQNKVAKICFPTEWQQHCND